MKLLVDQPVSPRLADWLRGQSHDAFHVRDRGLSRASDEELFALAKADERVIITADLDFSRILALGNYDRPGLILFRAGSISDDEMLTLLQQVLRRVPLDQIAHSVVVVEPQMLRIAALPLKSSD